MRLAWDQLAKQDFLFFCEYVSAEPWISGKHLALVARTLERVAAGEIRRLLILEPPRHGKTQMASINFPVWFLGNHPDDEIALASYGADLAEKFGGQARDLFRHWGPRLFNLTARPDTRAKGDWQVLGHKGAMVSVGLGGALTGRGARIAVVDDPIKNAEEAMSQAYCDKVWDWFQSVLRTRLTPDGAIVICLTHWSEMDLAGRIQKMAEGKLSGYDQEDWTIVRLPALAEEDDPLGRQEGAALWPERWGLEHLLEKKRTLASWWFSLYQQRPSPVEGLVVQRGWWKYFSRLPAQIDEMTQSWDCSFKDKKDSSYVVGQVWARARANKYLLDQFRARIDFPTTLRAIQMLSTKWPMAIAKLVEDKANGTAVIQTLQSQIPGIIAVEPQGGKLVRLRAVSPEIQSGNVFLPENAPWLLDYIEEFAVFPNGEHDDQVDATSQMLLWFETRNAQVPQVLTYYDPVSISPV